MRHFTAFVVAAFLLAGCASSQKTVAPSEETPSSEELAKLEAKVAEHPANPNERVTLARAYAGNGDYEQALSQLDAVLEADPAFDAALLEKADVLERVGRGDEGLQIYRDLLETPRGEAYVSRIAEHIGRPFVVTPIGLGSGDNAAPSFSPDGNKLVFQSNRDGNWEIYLHDFETETTVRLTDDEAMDEAPVFSPDGKWIAFTSTRDAPGGGARGEIRRDIFLMQPSGFEQHALTTDPADDWGASFSPNSQAVVFVSERDDPRQVADDQKLSDLYLVSVEGGDALRMTENQADDTSPVFGQGETTLYYASNRDGVFRIYRRNLETKSEQPVSSFTYPQGSPRVSAEGEWIVFFAKVGDNYDIYRMGSDGSRVQRLSNHPARDIGPAFAPDGRKIVFYTNRSGKYQIYQIDLTLPVSKFQLVRNIDELLSGGTN